MAHGKARNRLEAAREIALLASPTRIEIVDTLEALGGPVSVAELAAQLGRPADGLYYHLRQLAEGGLIRVEGGPDGRRYQTRSTRGERLTLRYRPGSNPNAQAVSRVAASLLRVAGRDFTRAIADAASVGEGPQRDLWAARGKGWVGRDDLAEINRLLMRLMELLQRPRSDRDDKLVSLSWVLAPIDQKPARRNPGKPARRGTRSRPNSRHD